MKIIRYTLEMPLQKWRNYKITEVAQIHMIAFWVTLVLSSLLMITYLICS